MSRWLWLACVVLGFSAVGCEDSPDKDVPDDTSDVVDDTGEVRDIDGDGFSANQDCDDENAEVHPDADEVCDGLDNNCDGVTDTDATDASSWYADSDGDGYGNAADAEVACDAPSGRVGDSSDCDDADGAVSPEGVEVCDTLDNNCDGSIDEDTALDAPTWYPDADADGYGDSASGQVACSAPSGLIEDGTDCDDTLAEVSPAGQEACNGIDDDCDGLVDEEDAIDPLTFFADTDTDGFGDAAASLAACDLPSGYVVDDTDCDDSDALVFPGASEFCNGWDDDCDGETDEADAVDVTPWYGDADGDGFGDVGVSSLSCAGSPAVEDSATSAPGLGIDDANAVTLISDSVSLGGCGLTSRVTVDLDLTHSYRGDLRIDLIGPTGTTTRLVSETFDPTADYVGTFADQGGDFTPEEALSVYAGQDSAGTWTVVIEDTYPFLDSGVLNSWGVEVVCEFESVADATDCDDSDPSISPAADELCDFVDNDCDSVLDEDDAVDALTWYADADGDGYGDALATASACSLPSGFLADDTDCNDADSAISPAADELCDSIDNDCDSVVDEDDAVDAPTWYADVDGDGYGDAASTTAACLVPTGYLADATDCDDTNAQDWDCVCGNGQVETGEEFEPAPGPFTSVSVDANTCRWDFTGVRQLYCGGPCSWAGSNGCDEADADVLCQLVGDDPAARALDWTTTAALDEVGFSCAPDGDGTVVEVDRGITAHLDWTNGFNDVRYLDSSLLLDHGPGDVVSDPVCGSQANPHTAGLQQGTSTYQNFTTAMRGNQLTMDAVATLSSFSMDLSVDSACTELDFYLLQDTAYGWGVLWASQVSIATTGAGTYSSGPIDLTLQPGNQYGTVVGWSGCTVDFSKALEPSNTTLVETATLTGRLTENAYNGFVSGGILSGLNASSAYLYTQGYSLY